MCQKMHIQKLVCRWLEPEIPSETFLKSTWANHKKKKARRRQMDRNWKFKISKLQSIPSNDIHKIETEKWIIS